MRRYKKLGFKTDKDHLIFMEASRTERRNIFHKMYNLHEKDIDFFAKLWLEKYGNRKSCHSSYNHHFLQGLIEHSENEWVDYHKKLSKDLRDIIEEKYPQLVINVKK